MGAEPWMPYVVPCEPGDDCPVASDLEALNFLLGLLLPFNYYVVRLHPPYRYASSLPLHIFLGCHWERDYLDDTILHQLSVLHSS